MILTAAFAHFSLCEMDKLDLIFRPASVADCYILNDWLRLEGWIFRTEEEVRQDPYGRMKFGVNLAAEDTKSKIGQN